MFFARRCAEESVGRIDAIERYENMIDYMWATDAMRFYLTVFHGFGLSGSVVDERRIYESSIPNK